MYPTQNSPNPNINYDDLEDYTLNLISPEDHLSPTDLQLQSSFLQSYYENAVDYLTGPEEFGIRDREKALFEFAPLSLMWEEESSVKKEQKKTKRQLSKSICGLKRLSIRVRDTVLKHYTSSYRRVSETVIQEIQQTLPSKEEFDIKNVRRRVYDTLHILTGTYLVDRIGKQVQWKGYSSIKQHPFITQRTEKVQAKKEILSDLIIKLIALKGLITRNYTAKRQQLNVKFPFIVVALENKRRTRLNLQTNLTCTQVTLKNSNSVRIMGDVDTLVNLNLHQFADYSQVPEEALKLCNLLTI